MTQGRETRATRERPRVFARRALLVACGGALASTLPCADAQESAEPVGTLSIEVTGTHLKRTDAETALPLQVFTREDLQKGGIQTVEDLLQRISANQSRWASATFSTRRRRYRTSKTRFKSTSIRATATRAVACGVIRYAFK